MNTLVGLKKHQNAFHPVRKTDNQASEGALAIQRAQGAQEDPADNPSRVTAATAYRSG